MPHKVRTGESVMKWYDRALVCEGCGKVGWRPFNSSRPCAWCGGSFAFAAEVRS